jgi:prepilin signal peptidase PulO-like enzyme (type II secretory pathway)
VWHPDHLAECVSGAFVGFGISFCFVTIGRRWVRKRDRLAMLFPEEAADEFDVAWYRLKGAVKRGTVRRRYVCFLMFIQAYLFYKSRDMVGRFDLVLEGSLVLALVFEVISWYSPV